LNPNSSEQNQKTPTANDDSALTAPQKKELCAFLEEALCNVGKHAIGATRLRVVCKQEQEICHLQIVDNGAGLKVSANGTPTRVRGGTKHAIQLAKQMGGNFRRETSPPQGTICELSWSIFGK
jgi:two-component sensor histidine kinase